jgi:hypothetical protein
MVRRIDLPNLNAVENTKVDSDEVKKRKHSQGLQIKMRLWDCAVDAAFPP